MFRSALLGAVALLPLLNISGVAQAAGTSSHAMVVAGQAQGSGSFACATSAPQARESAFFNTGVGLPTEGYSACSLAGGITNQTSVTGPSFSHQDVTASFNNGVAALLAEATAGYGSLGVRSTGTYTGFQDGFTYKGAEGAAYVTDTLTFAGTGTVNIFLGWTVDGSSSTTGSSQTLTFLNYQVGAGPIFSALVAGSGGGASMARVVSPQGGGGTVPGFTVGPNSLSGSGDVYSFFTPVTLGTAFDLTVGLYAASYPTAFTGIALNDFFSTARLTSIRAYDVFGNRVAFSITSASGTVYDETGAHPVVGAPAVPEPSSWLMAVLGFGMIGGAIRRLHRTTVPLAFG
jgi:PEP-CTERM motif